MTFDATSGLSPDPACALALLGAGYWVVPLTGYRKSPPRAPGGSRTHGDIIGSGDREFMEGWVRSTARTSTGWALVLWDTDPFPLIAIDLDAQNLDRATAWASLANSDPEPAGGVAVRSASAGWHFYFRLPEGADPKKVPGIFDFGHGRKGELRVSRRPVTLLVLPGSVCRNKHNELGVYAQDGPGDLRHPADIPTAPATLFSRLLNRSKAEAPVATEGMPTEAAHLLGLLHFISEIPPGHQNSTIAQLGQILGRIGPGDRPSPEVVSNAWDALRDRLPTANAQDPWTFSAFEKPLVSGYKTGKRSRDQHSPTPGVPSRDDLVAECEALFGSMPWLIEVTDSNGEFVEYIMGIGADKDNREQATGLLRVRHLKDIIATLMRLVPAADRNAVLKSPLHLTPIWRLSFEALLKAERSEERLGDEPTEQFWSILRQWATSAATDGQFLQTFSGKRDQLQGNQWIVAASGGDVDLVLNETAVERLFKKIGDNGKVKQLISKHFQPARGLNGNHNRKVRVISVSTLGEETSAVVQRGYEKWLAARRSTQATETTNNDQMPT